ncbi:MAG: BatA domain-containing protein, partial [Planctomycetota bacterium]
MPFVHPLGLIGLTLASAPIIIHLLNRRRFKIVEWAAMEFLMASQRKNYRRIRLEQLLLMALRALMIAVLILLVCRPTMRRALAGIAERERLVALVFDTSMSMAYRDGSTSAYDRGITFAERLMAGLSQGDTWALVAAEGPGRKVTHEPSFELEAARAAVAPDRLALSDRGTSLPAALAAAEEVLASSRTPAKAVYVVTDMQRASWLPPTGSVAADDVERLKDLSREQAEVMLVDVGSREPANLAVTELRLVTPFAVVGGEATVRARVSNFTPSDAAGVRLELFVDGFRQQTGAPRNIASGETAQWEFRHVFRQGGPHAVMVELEADSLPRDDRRYLAVDVRETLRVLCVEGEPGGESFTGETDYLRAVLRPARREQEQEVSPFTPEVAELGALASAELPRYDAVVLANVARLDEPVAAALERYVRDGGALLVFLGDQVDRAFYNQRLYREGRGVLPCVLGPPVGDPADRTQAVHLQERVGDHPFVRLFREQKVIKLSSPYVARYIRLEGVEGRERVRVVCRFDGGDPAVVESRAGRGRVVVFASSADDEWNDMPSWPMYQTLVHEVLSQVVRDPSGSRNLT